MTKKYAGIGSRRTPPDILQLMIKLGMQFGRKGYLLRSGAAPGADSAFEAGCDHVGGAKEIYLPWKGAFGHDSPLYTPHPLGFEIIDSWWPGHESHHAARKLWARNFQQILGADLENPDPVDFVICWTVNGKRKGGTARALEMADEFNIPIINLYNQKHLLDHFDL